MKKILYLLLFAPLFALGQTGSQNYVKTLTYKEETETSDPNKAHATVTYYDGLGRPIQQVAGKMATTGKDIITHITYDGFGRQTKEFLPYPSGASDLSYQGSAGTDVLTYYGSVSTTPGLGPQEATGNPYSEKFFEPSPLNRIVKQAAPGNAWAGNEGNNNDHTIKYAYMANSESDGILMFKAQAGPNVNSNTLSYDISLVSNGETYPANQLYKNIVQNENKASALTISGSKNFYLAIEYKNKEGQLVAKQQDYSSYDNYGMPVYGTMYTYYVYDQFGNLTYVLPPGVGENPTEAVLSGICYRYKYDGRNRLVEKQIPGKQWEYIVYDVLDRPILTGPALTPFGGATSVPTNQGWMVSVYDTFGRVAITGWFQGNVTAATRKTWQVNYGGTSVRTAVRGSSTIDGVATGYTITGPALPAGFKILSVNYYDDYTWPGAPTLPSDVEGQAVRSNVKGLPSGSWTRVLSSATSASDNEVSYILYDTRSRAVRSYIKNYLGGYNQVDTKLDFTGKPITTITRHKKTSATTDAVITTTENFTYDAQDRVVSHGHDINGITNQTLSSNTYDELGHLITKRLGIYRPTTSSPIQPMQTVDYKYNVRGWLTDINDVNALGSDLFAFRISYNNVDNSDDPMASSLYNGNISETYWRTSTDNILRKYTYRYDNINRLSSAYYRKPGTVVEHAGSYNENITYDSRGNIRKLVRTGGLDDLTNAVEIDRLLYTYKADSNQLEKVNDESNSPQGFKDVQTSSNIEYTYDSLGNMITDLNKGIAQIKYNHLNLPTEITYTGSTNKITYLYNASGKKVQKTVKEGSATLVVDYLEGFQYKGGVLQFFPHAEGYVDYTPATGIFGADNYNYVFQYKDHLGNVRASFGTNGKILNPSVKILEENHYYPFGLKHSNYNMDYLQYQEIEGSIVLYPPISLRAKLPNNYKYNGKELQDELGLNMYDYGWRSYMPDIGRWMQTDPLHNDLNFAFDDSQVDEDDGEEILQAIITKAETGGGIYNVNNLNPYVYGYNSPVVYDDPDGRCPTCIVGAIVGAAVDYGTQVASNYIQGSENPWTSNINVTSIVLAGVEGAMTQGGSAIKKIGVKVAVAAVNNAVEYNSTDGWKSTTNVSNIVKNTALDLGVKNAIGSASKLAGSNKLLTKAASKVTVGSTNKATKVIKAATGLSTRAANTVAKKTDAVKLSKKLGEGIKNLQAKTAENATTAATKQKADELKKKTDQ